MPADRHDRRETIPKCEYPVANDVQKRTVNGVKIETNTAEILQKRWIENNSDSDPS